MGVSENTNAERRVETVKQDGRNGAWLSYYKRQLVIKVMSSSRITWNTPYVWEGEGYARVARAEECRHRMGEE